MIPETSRSIHSPEAVAAPIYVEQQRARATCCSPPPPAPVSGVAYRRSPCSTTEATRSAEATWHVFLFPAETQRRREESWTGSTRSNKIAPISFILDAEGSDARQAESCLVPCLSSFPSLRASAPLRESSYPDRSPDHFPLTEQGSSRRQAFSRGLGEQRIRADQDGWL